MKKTLLITAFLICVFVLNMHAQTAGTATNTEKPTTIGLVIYSNDAETVWNALRFANYSRNQGDTVSIFLLGKGVELDNLVKSHGNIKEQSDVFIHDGGTILGCGTCLQSRNNNEPQMCKFSTMKDLYDLIRNNKIVMTF